MANPPTSTVNLTASGLNTQPNELSVPPGSLDQASDIIIRRDNVIEPRRGFKLYGESFGESPDRADQIFQYKDRILRHYNTILQYDTDITDVNGQSIFNDFCGSFSEVSPGTRIKSIEANGNFYFTTSNGIQKISARTAADFTTACGFITPAGGIKALDPQAFLDYTYGLTSGFLPDDSVVAYRVVWGTNDANNNLILGVPSARVVVFNSLQQMIVRDYMNVLQALDDLDIPTESNYTDGDYVSSLALTLESPATDIQTNLLELVAKLDAEEGTLIASGAISVVSVSSLGVCTVSLNTSSAGLLGKMQIGDEIFLEGSWTDALSTPVPQVQTVTGLTLSHTGDSISFINTNVAAGLVTLQGASITSGWFRSITQPPTPDTPATNAELVVMQNYLQSIILELQSPRDVLISANTTSVGAFPLKISSASVTTTTNLQITFTTPNAKNTYIVGDKIFLDGTWTGPSGSLGGYYTITSIPTTSIVDITIPTSTTGSVTLGADAAIDLITRFSTALQIEFIDSLTITLSANVELIIPIPQEVTPNYFLQIYRSNVETASQTDVLADLVPDDEMRLVYEAFPTPAQLAAESVTVVDITPQSFFQGGAFLYTDESNGVGILQANEVPPVAYDINTFKNVTFYANTRTKHRLTIAMLGVSKIINDYIAGNNPTFSIASALGYSNYKFIEGVNETTNITLPAGSVFNTTTSNYFTISGGNDIRQYYVWFNVFGGTDVDPALDGLTGIEVVINSTDTNLQVAQNVCNALNVIVDDFNAVVTSNVVTVQNIVAGPTSDINPLTAIGTMSGVTGYAATITTQGDGENVANQVTTINSIAGSAFTPTGTADYFLINSAFNRQIFYVWFNVNGGNTNPFINGTTGIEVDVLSSDDSTATATKIVTALNALTNIFTATSDTNIVTVTNFSPGPALNATEFVVDSGFTIATPTEGTLNVLLSNSISPSLAVQETTQSLINVINKNNAEIVYGYYLSGTTDVPGNFLLEERTIQDVPFYVSTNETAVGSSFNPDLSPTFTISNITATSPTIVTTTTSSQVANKDSVMIVNSNSFPPIDGINQITGVNGNNFTIQADIISSGNTGFGIDTLDANISSNETKPNRVYYSKYLQPEAVPLVNFLDIGAQDKAILRIFPLRDSLFVLKEDGVYRISGETAPFNVALFDTSYVCIAADSVAIANNTIYGWTTQGIMTLTESGSQIISRAIDVNLLPLASDLYPNFSTATFGVGYNSDYSYIIWTVSDPIDTVATQAYVYNNLTSTWVRWDKSNTCGIVFALDNKLYLGDGTENFIEQERKDFTVTDYADKELAFNIATGNYQVDQAQLKFFQLNNINTIDVGDVIAQEQLVSIYDMNTLLTKLDNDPTVNTPFPIQDATYFSASKLVEMHSTEVIDSIQSGVFITIEGVNPIGYNGTFQLDSVIDNIGSTTLFFTLNNDPGVYISGGTFTFSFESTVNPTPGTSLRTALETTAEFLNTINNNITELNYVQDISDISIPNMLVSADFPTIFSTSSNSVSSIDGSNPSVVTVLTNPFNEGDGISFTSTGTLPSPLDSSASYTAFNVFGNTFNVLDDMGNALVISTSWVGNLNVYLNHDLKTNRYINVFDSTTTPNINQNYSITYVSPHEFSIDADVITGGTASIETLVDSFQDIQACFNILVDDLNSTISTTTFKNYEHVTSSTSFETPVTTINYALKQLQIETVVPFIIGPITVYKAITSTFEYSPISMNDGLSLKHFREATVIYLNKTFSFAQVGFASDLLPEIVTVPVPGFGNGLQGNELNGEGYYGGDSNSSPFRTYIPLEKARCRFLRISHTHSVAREKYSILGTSLTGRIVSTRGYR